MKGCQGTARANVVAKKDSRLLVGGESIFYETCAGRARQDSLPLQTLSRLLQFAVAMRDAGIRDAWGRGEA